MFGAMLRGIKAVASFVARAALAAAAWLKAHAPTPETPWVARLIFHIKLFSAKAGFWLGAAWSHLARPERDAVGCLVFRRGKVLLVRRVYGPDVWVLPGGGLLPQESPTDAASRHVFEALGLTMDQVFHLGYAWDQVFRGEDHVTYLFGEAEAGDPVLDPLEVKEARWFGPLTLPFPVSNRVLTALDLYDRFSAGTTVVLSEAIRREKAPF